MPNNYEEIKNNLKQEYEKLKVELEKTSNKLERTTKNKFETKIYNILICSLFPFFLSIGLINTSIIPQLIPVVMFSSAIVVGPSINYLIKSKKERKREISFLKSFKYNNQIREEEVKQKINFEVTKNKMRVLETLLNQIIKKEELNYIKKDNFSNLTQEEINKNINELKISLLKAFDELDVKSKRKVISHRFLMCRDKVQMGQEIFMVPLLLAVFFMISINLPVHLAGGTVNLLSILLPLPITQVLGSSYVVKKINNDRKIFEKLNKGLNKNGLSKKYNHISESNKALENSINEKIEDVCIIYSELLEQQKMLEIKQEIEKEVNNKNLSKTSKFVIDNKKPIMSVYGIYNNYFKTKEGLKNFCLLYNYSEKHSYRLDYMGDYLGKNDVIRTVDHSGAVMHYAMADNDGYACFNKKRSEEAKEFIWEYEFGEIRNLYNVFKTNGITLTNDIYLKLDLYHKSIYEAVMNMSNETEINKQKVLKKENNQ